MAKKKIGNKELVDRLRTSNAKICPINKNAKIKMSKNGFVQACLSYQKQTNKKKRSYTDGKSHVGDCKTCEIGISVKSGKETHPPTNITIIQLDTY